MSAKTGAVVAVSPRFLRAKEAYKFLGAEQTLRDCESANWIKPARRHHKLTLYSTSSLHLCADRIEAGEYPEKVAPDIRERRVSRRELERYASGTSPK